MAARLHLVLVVSLLAAACSKKPEPRSVPDEGPAPSNRIAVPETVRKNLGIDFVRVARRRVAQTLRFSGHFELLTTARHELRTPVQGRITLLVKPLQSVQAGDPVFRVDSPDWRQAQREIGEIETQIRVDEARLAAMQPLVVAHREHEQSLREAVSVLEARQQNVEETQSSVGGQARELSEARAQLAQVRADLAEAREKGASTDATLAEAQAQLIAGRDRFRLALEAAAAVTGTSVEQLLGDAPGATGSSPYWRVLSAIEVRASAAGVVDQLQVASGSWLATGQLVVTVSDLGQVRFRARGLQSDLPRLRSGLSAQAVPALSTSAAEERVPGALLLGSDANPSQRTLDLFLEPNTVPAWARPGVAGFLEIETAGAAEPVLAIPLAATLQDGLERVLFRRDPADADKVIRLEADLGLDDGRWVEVKSGLREGDEVVLAGAYELMLASSGSAAKGGHFHSDGTFHAGEHK
jgi:HlyD family secretion protein